MLTDLYELTMMYGFFKNGLHKKTAVFDLYFRKQNESNYAIFAGLEQVVEYIQNIAFTPEDLAYLRSLRLFDEAFLAYLADFRFTGDLRSVPEGAVIFADQPILVVKAPLAEAVFLESAVLNIINHQTLIATKSSRVAYAADGAAVAEFGLRRAQGPDAAVYGARAAIIGGCASTSNVYAAKAFGLPASGTMAHSWVMAFGDELSAFRAYAKEFPDHCLLLADTYNTLESGVPNAITVFRELSARGRKPVGIRLDSGDFAYLSKRAREMLDEAGFPEVKIFCSGDLDEYVIQSLKIQGARIDMWGVGTRLITSFTTPSLGGVYKLAALEENGALRPKIKISNSAEKTTVPAEKEIYRLYEGGKAVADLITLADEEIDTSRPLTIFHPVETWKRRTLTDFTARKILTDIIKKGKRVYKLPSVEEIAAYKRENFSDFWEEYKRLDRPQLYIVDLSEKLYNLKKKMMASGGEHGGQS